MSSFTLQELRSMVYVGMGDYKVACGETKLITRDLGSCVGVAIRDPQTNVGGLLHVMLPEYVPSGVGEPAKFADTGIDEMVRILTRAGAEQKRLVAKIAGGAHMIMHPVIMECNDISAHNVQAVKRKLNELHIPLLAEEVGDHYPRTVVFNTASGVLRIVTAGRKDRML